MRLLRPLLAIGLVLGVAAATRPANAQIFLRVDELLSRTLVNASRATTGAGPLTESPQLDVMARAQAARMAARGDIYHNPNLASDISASGLAWLRVGENVGVGPDIPVIHAAFLASPHHRENLMNPAYTLMGMGVAPGTGNMTGMMFVAHVFAQVQGATVARATAAPAPRPPATASPVRRPLQTPVPTLPRTPAPTPAPSPTPNALVGGVVDEVVRL
jgi:hypothetical protein